MKPERIGDIETVLVPNPSTAVKVSLRPPTPAPIAKFCDAGYEPGDASATP